MQALLIKYHGPTSTKGSRISLRSVGYRAIFVERDDQNFEDQAEQCAEMYFAQMFRVDTEKQKFAIGTLPNGDLAAVLI